MMWRWFCRVSGGVAINGNYYFTLSQWLASSMIHLYIYIHTLSMYQICIYIGSMIYSLYNQLIIKIRENSQFCCDIQFWILVGIKFSISFVPVYPQKSLRALKIRPIREQWSLQAAIDIPSSSNSISVLRIIDKLESTAEIFFKKHMLVLQFYVLLLDLKKRWNNDIGLECLQRPLFLKKRYFFIAKKVRRYESLSLSFSHGRISSNGRVSIEEGGVQKCSHFVYHRN